jgi:hypothetical protein
MISHVVPKVYTGQRPIDYDIGLTYDYHLGEVVHSVENCKVLRHHIQDLIDHEVLKFGGVPDISTNPLPKHLKGMRASFKMKKMIASISLLFRSPR